MRVRFNPRTRVGCEFILGLHFCEHRVSIHAPVWGANVSIWLGVSGMRFNPRTRVGCEHVGLAVFDAKTFQSTHPCGVRKPVSVGCRYRRVSIHAPVWGAKNNNVLSCMTYTFQSTHPCGVRNYIAAYGDARLKFQSTHPCGVRNIRKLL